MCWCFSLGFRAKEEKKGYSTSEKPRRNRQDGALRGQGKTIDVSNQRKSKECSRKQRSAKAADSPRPSNQQHSRRRHPGDTKHSTDLRSAEQRAQRQPSQYHHHDVLRNQHQYRPSLKVHVPEMWRKLPETSSNNSSQEALLNPRPYRSPNHRQKHPKRSSQTTLRGRGAKLDPPRQTRPKNVTRSEPPRGWSILSSVSPKTPSRNNYRNLQSTPRHRRSPHRDRSFERPQTGEALPIQQQMYSRRPPRPHTPNTTAHRVPDRRFAVLAATNYALEEVRREAFAQQSPPPRRERLRRYEGMTIPTSQIPFNWDCVSSSQASAGLTPAEPSQRQRRPRR